MKKTSGTAWEATLFIVDRLRSAGHVALLAGGCVRDRLLGREPQDYDVATNALPDQVCGLFPRARLVGVKFGVVVVPRLGHQVEVATFRSDGVYSDGRRPDDVVFGDERGDALRRDFTINGLFYDPVADRVIDYVAGQADLQDRLIRTIGDPDVRFGEDHLRMLRAVRLSARLGFAVTPETRAAIRRLAPHLQAISPERIWMELEQILTDPSRASGWNLLCELGLRDHLCPDWPVDARADAMASKRLLSLPNRPLEPGLVLAATLGPRNKDQVERLGRSLRLSNELVVQTWWLLGNMTAAYRADGLELADFKPLRASPNWPLLLELLRADLLANESDLSAYEAAKQRGESMSRKAAAPPPLVTGDDLLQRGFESGPQLGEILRCVYRAQLNEEIATQQQGIELAQTLLGR